MILDDQLNCENWPNTSDIVQLPRANEITAVHHVESRSEQCPSKFCDQE